MPMNIKPRHLLPVGPVMAPAVPFTEGVSDVFVPERGAEGAVVFDVGIVLAHSDDQINLADGVDLAAVIQVGNIVAGGVKVDVVVVVAAKEVAHIIFAAQGDDPFEALRMAQSKVEGVIGAKATAVGDQVGIAIFLLDERQHLVQEVSFKLHVAFDPATGMRPATVEALHINAIDTVELKPALVDIVPQVGDHAAVFIFIETPPACREDDDRRAGVTMNQ